MAVWAREPAKGAPLLRRTLASAAGTTSFAAEGEEIAGDGVVEADQRRENAGDKEDLGQIAEQDGTVGLQEDKHQVRSELR